MPVATFQHPATGVAADTFSLCENIRIFARGKNPEAQILYMGLTILLRRHTFAKHARGLLSPVHSYPVYSAAPLVRGGR